MKFVGIVVIAVITDIEWYKIACINAILVVMFGGAVMALPKSPSFLAIQNKEEEARKVLRLIRGPKADVEAELAILKQRNERNNGNYGFAALFKLDMLRQIAALIVLLLIRDLSGSDVVMVHTTRMLRDSGVILDPGLSTFIVTSMGLCGAILLSLVVDRIGRRWSMMVSFMMMAVGYVMLGFYCYFMPPLPPLQPDLEIRLLSPLDDNTTVSYQLEARCKMPLF